MTTFLFFDNIINVIGCQSLAALQNLSNIKLTYFLSQTLEFFKAQVLIFSVFFEKMGLIRKKVSHVKIRSNPLIS